MVWMDVCESQQGLRKHSKVETPRTSLLTADKNNGTTRRTRTREVSSRYRSPTPVPSSGPRRCPSPTVTRTATTTSSVPKRAISAERKRPSTSPSPPSSYPSTPVQDTSTDMLLACRKIAGNRLPESLWPSTMRSLSVSFQSDSFSLPVSKREKPVSHALTDRTLRPSSNVAHKQNETPPGSRKPTPERKRSPLKGKNSVDQSENSRPMESLHARLVEQHRWPSRAGGKVSTNALNRSIDLTVKASRISSLPQSGLGMPSLRRLSLDGMNKPLQKSASDLLSLISSDEGSGQGIKAGPTPSDDNTLLIHKPISSILLESTKLLNSSVRSQSLPISGSRPPSPSKPSISSSSVSRGISPSRAKTANTVPSRGSSPSRTRPSSPSRQSNNATSVLSFIADIRKGKKAANHIEDVHQIRLLYNRHLQWRFANAQADIALRLQEEKAEKILYNVWRSTSDLWDLVIQKRIELQQLRLKLKLHLILSEQLAYLKEWASIEEDHTESLSQAIKDLEASTLRLPIMGGARGDIQAVKSAICSAVDVMQAMGSSVGFVLSQVGEMNCLVSELADVAAQERAMLDECEALLASTAAMQVEEYSLRTNLVQLQEAWRSDQLILGN